MVGTFLTPTAPNNYGSVGGMTTMLQQEEAKEAGARGDDEHGEDLVPFLRHNDLRTRQLSATRTSVSEQSLEIEKLSPFTLETTAEQSSLLLGQASISNEIVNISKNLIGGGVLSLSGGQVSIFALCCRLLILVYTHPFYSHTIPLLLFHSQNCSLCQRSSSCSIGFSLDCSVGRLVWLLCLANCKSVRFHQSDNLSRMLEQDNGRPRGTGRFGRRGAQSSHRQPRLLHNTLSDVSVAPANCGD